MGTHGISIAYSLTPNHMVLLLPHRPPLQLIPTFTWVDVRRHTPPRSTVGCFLPRQSFLVYIITHSVQPPSLWPSSCLRLPSTFISIALLWTSPVLISSKKKIKVSRYLQTVSRYESRCIDESCRHYLFAFAPLSLIRI